jgi:hypothetical protein
MSNPGVGKSRGRRYATGAYHAYDEPADPLTHLGEVGMRRPATQISRQGI